MEQAAAAPADVCRRVPVKDAASPRQGFEESRSRYGRVPGTDVESAATAGDGPSRTHAQLLRATIAHIAARAMCSCAYACRHDSALRRIRRPRKQNTGHATRDSGHLEDCAGPHSQLLPSFQRWRGWGEGVSVDTTSSMTAAGNRKNTARIQHAECTMQQFQPHSCRFAQMLRRRPTESASAAVPAPVNRLSHHSNTGTCEVSLAQSVHHASIGTRHVPDRMRVQRSGPHPLVRAARAVCCSHAVHSKARVQCQVSDGCEAASTQGCARPVVEQEGGTGRSVAAWGCPSTLGVDCR